MAALRTAKQVLRRDLKRRVAALTDEEKRRQSHVLSQKVRESRNSFSRNSLTLIRRSVKRFLVPGLQLCRLNYVD